MAQYNTGDIQTFPIGAAIARGIFVTINTSGQVVAAANGANAIGVTLEAVTTAQYDSGNGQVTVPVLVKEGVKVPVLAGAAAVAIGDNAAADTGGLLITAATGDTILGVVLEAKAGSTSGVEVVIFFQKAGAVA